MKLMMKKDELLMANQFNVFLERQMSKNITIEQGFEENSKIFKWGFKVYCALRKWGFGIKSL